MQTRFQTRSDSFQRRVPSNRFALLLALLTAAGYSAAQNFPSRAIRMVVPSSPGGTTDIVARMLAPRLSDALGQQVVVDNRAGAGTIIGTDIIAKSAPDGYSLLMGLSTLAIDPHLQTKLPYDAVRDLTPVSLAVAVPNVLALHPSVPAKSIRELIGLAKAQPRSLICGSAGLGTSPHLSAELFKTMAHIDFVHVPFKGSGQGIISLLGGEIAMMFPALPTAIQYLKSGRLRGLGVTTATRSPAMPAIRAINETLPGYDATQWFGVLGPAALPRPIVDRLQQEIVKALRNPEMKTRLTNEGADVIASTPEEFSAYIKAETDKWGKVIRDAALKPQ